MTKKRSTTWVLLAVAAFSLLGSLLVVGGCIVWLGGPVESERTLLFEVDDGSAASVYISDKLVGTTPLKLTHEELEAYFEPYSGPWPPPNVSSSGSSRVGSFTEEDADFYPEGGTGDNVWYLRTSQDDITEMMALHYRVEAADGRTLERGGSSSSGFTVFRSHKTDHEFSFH